MKRTHRTGLRLAAVCLAIFPWKPLVAPAEAEDQIGTLASYWPQKTTNYCRRWLVEPGVDTLADTKAECSAFCKSRAESQITCSCYPISSLKWPGFCARME
jgi:hypothetical protein